MRRIFFAGIVGLALTFIFIFIIQKRTYLLIENIESREVYAVYLQNNSRFCLKFTHSVALSPVEEWFRAQNQRIVLESTVYEDFGAGLPHDVGPGQKMFVENGKVRITGFNVSLLSLQARVGRIANHQLLIEKEKMEAPLSVPLHFFASPGKSLKFSIQDISLLIALQKQWKEIDFL